MNILIDNRIIGNADKDRKVFTKHVQKSKHLFKKLDAWGIDAEVLDKLVEKDYRIIVKDRDESKNYYVTASEWKEKGDYLHFKPHRAQVFLPLVEFDAQVKKPHNSPTQT